LAILIKSSHVAIVVRDLLKRDNQAFNDEEHLQAAMDWICMAQDITECGGVSAGYSLIKGWLGPYPETTGYIIPTFLRFAASRANERYIERAIAMGDWEIEIQLSSGAVRGGFGINNYPIVFNTGQVMLGWISLYNGKKLERFLDAAKRAADWLLSIQDSDGKWSKHTFRDIPHAYHTRVAWPLLNLYQVTKEEKYKISAEKQITWALNCSKENGWFDYMGFKVNEFPFTHTIAYTLDGLIESSHHLVNAMKDRIVKIVCTALENIVAKYRLNKEESFQNRVPLPATLDEKWESKDYYSCLTGDAQIAILLLKIYAICKIPMFWDAAFRLIENLKIKQSVDSKDKFIRGAIAGSYPIWGRYSRFCYPNWATKFFADALMLKRKIEHEMV